MAKLTPMQSYPRQANDGGTDTADYSNNTAGPKTSLAVASFDPNGYIARDGGDEMVEVKFSKAGVDPSRAAGIRVWASCTGGETAVPRQLTVTLKPGGRYKNAIFTTNVTKAGLNFTEKITEQGKEVILQGKLTVSRACGRTCMVDSVKEIAEPCSVLSL
jgi:hypothetical protein